MEVSVLGRVKEAIEHRFVTKLSVEPYDLDDTIVDVVAPTYVADDNNLNNYQAVTISPTLATWIGTSSMPFNKLIYISQIDMKKFKEDMKKLKEKRVKFASIGYGGLSINVLHFMSLLAYRVGVNDVFEELHIFEDDNISASNMIRFYKDMWRHAVPRGAIVSKLDLFDEENLASNITLHKYRLDEDSIAALKEKENVIFFGAPDFETRKLLEGEKFLFAGHQGDGVILVKSPVVDELLTRESYGTINMTSFFINMMVVTAAIVDTLANGFEDADDDTILFSYNAKEKIVSTKPKVLDIDTEKGIGVYQFDEQLKIAI